MPVKTKKCEWCGETFLTYKHRSIYCSDTCRKESAYARQKAYRKEAEKKTEPAVITSTLAETNQAAREAGMSYGKYVGMLWLKEHKW